MTKDEAMKDLEDKVRELMMDSVEDAIKKLHHLQASGANIAQDHIDAAGPWATPKNFVVAYADEMKWQYQPIQPNRSRAWTRLIKHYSTMM